MKLLKILGPGFITAALVFGPGSITVNSKLGAQFGFNLLWVIVCAALFMSVYTMMSARIGLTLHTTLLVHIRNKYGVFLSTLIGLGSFLVTLSFQAGNAAGVGLSLGELTGTSMKPWIILFSLIAIGLLFARGFYKILEKLMVALVVLMLLSFLLTLAIIQPSLSEIMAGLHPALPSGSGMLVIALVASTFSVTGAFFQSYLVREKGWRAGELKDCRREGITGIALLGLISMTVMVGAAAVLKPNGLLVTSAGDMAKAIAPLYGKVASSVYMLGLFAASFSSLLGNATIGGALLADTLGLNTGLASSKARYLIMLVISFGAAIAFIFGGLPLQFIVFAQAVTILAAPLTGIMLLVVSNEHGMGPMKNKMIANILAVAGLAFIILLMIANYKLVFK